MNHSAPQMVQSSIAHLDANKSAIEKALELLEMELGLAYAKVFDVFLADYDVVPAQFGEASLKKLDKMIETGMANLLVGRHYTWRHKPHSSVLTIYLNMTMKRTKSRFATRLPAYRTAVFAFPKDLKAA